MELSLRKTTLALVALGLSGIASAASYAPPAPACTPGAVTVPCERTAFDLGFTAYWLEPVTDNSFMYETVTVVGDTTTFNQHVVDEDYDFGFTLEGSYHWGTGNDFTLSWTRFDNDNDSALIDGNFAVRGAEDYQFDQVIGVIGQHADFGDRYNVRFNAGLQYVRVDTAQGVRIHDTRNPAVVADFTNIEGSNFSGVGPIAGIDTSWDVMDGFALTGSAAAGLAVGDIDSTTVAWLGNAVIGSVMSERTIVPTANMKLGVRYTTEVAGGDLNIDAGWAFMGVFHSVRYINAAGIAAGTANTSNFGLQGPYLGVKWIGDLGGLAV